MAGCLGRLPEKRKCRHLNFDALAEAAKKKNLFDYSDTGLGLLELWSLTLLHRPVATHPKNDFLVDCNLNVALSLW